MKPFRSRIPAAVLVLGTASFLTDLSSEMIYPLLPLFLISTLGAGALSLGLIEGLAESTTSLLKIVSGIWTDRVKVRKPFVVAGYGLAGTVRPLIGLATVWPMVLVLRFLDRVGKGIRTSPRDALIADVTEPAFRGAAFGFHRAMDHAGAVAGPLVAFALLRYLGLPLRTIFLLAGIPAALVIVVLVFALREPRREAPPISPASKPSGPPRSWADLGRDFHLFLLAVILFTLGNSTDAFLLLRLADLGVDAAGLAILWSIFHVVKVLSTYGGGGLADRFGRKPLIVSGWLFYAAIYFAFSMVDSPAGVVAVFLTYGVYFGLAEPAERAFVAGLVAEPLRGTAFGFFHGAVGLAALPASLLFGALWIWVSPQAAFLTGAALAGLASVVLLAGTRGRQAPGRLA